MDVNYLVQSDEASSFLNMAGSETGARAFLGDATQHPTVGNSVTQANIALHESIEKIRKLTTDPTRNEYQKHGAAKEIAVKVIETLEKSSAAIAKESTHLMQQAGVYADIHFSPKANTDGLYTEIRSWIKEQVKIEGGINNIRTQMMKNEDLAAVVWHSPNFLLNIPANIHDTLKYEGLNKFHPDVYADMSRGILMSDMQAKYAKVIHNVKRFYYNPALADKAALRVEV